MQLAGVWSANFFIPFEMSIFGQNISIISFDRKGEMITKSADNEGF